MSPDRLAPILFCLFLPFHSTADQSTPAEPDWVALDQAEWPRQDNVAIGNKIYVVTYRLPTQKQACHVVSFDAFQIVCSRHFGRKPRAFQQPDVLALISAGHVDWSGIEFYRILGLEGGLIAGSVLLAPISTPGAIALGVTGSLGNLLLLMVAAYAADSHSSGTSDTLFYLAPNQQLHVKLH